MQLLRFSLLVVLSLCATRLAAQSQCSITLNGLSKIEEGTPVRITAQVPPTIPATNLTFKWTLSVGTITAGENTSSITIDTTGLGGQRVSVSVEVIGAPTTCDKTAQKTFDVEPRPRGIHKFDEYGDITFEHEKARLDNFAIQLQNINGSRFGHIVASAGRRTYPNEARERLTRARNYLVKVRGISLGRIITIDAGHTEDLRVTLWILPGGFSPLFLMAEQIPRDQVEFTKRRLKPPPKQKRRH